MTSSYTHLFSPIDIGKVHLKNRIVKTAAQTYFFESGERRFGGIAKAFYGAVARGGPGLVICETPAMEAPYKETDDRRYRVDDDRFLPDIEALAAEVHKHDCPLFLQFYHRGPWGGVYAVDRRRIAASAVTVASPFDVYEPEPPHALTTRGGRGGRRGVRGRRRCARPAAASTASRSTPPTTTCCPPSSRASGTSATTATARRAWRTGRGSWSRSSQGIKQRVGPDFPVQVRMNAIEIGAGAGGLHDRRGQGAGRAAGGRRRRLPAREVPLDGHAPGLVQPGGALLSGAAHPA